ncbi:MBL fold metallo-hydrolase [Sphingosinicella rhizophila]|uniref:MBL fold metallo-hydrolase n=1 Tax=Sphingosinicella rhizophila TaxID=3050082 RepID=A0ABU3Q4J9_9SPHN|nr:MBL fold metallo-hydrolase [Sphingosinicella sp. GR2756]MDT9598319.1 MBL fold metallo-hydrolase [Sphingosinicella sp. GR2756]
MAGSPPDRPEASSATASPPAPDASLADAGGAYSHRGLTYPLGRTGPETGQVIALADGVGWARLPVPGSLKHINVWILEDEGGIALVDTGLNIAACREAWEALFSGPLAGKPITRILCTHFHPDHVGLAGWLTQRFDVSLWMTRDEWLFARMLLVDVRESPPREALAFWRAAGWDEGRIEAEAARGWGRFAEVVSPVPVSFVRIRDGENLRIGGRSWRVVIGNGHCPEHACLLDEEGGLLIAGDQVLPRITSNVSLGLSEPESDPLGDWLDSIARLRSLPEDLLVLPSHGEPFTGLHARLDALDHGHRDRLDALHKHLSEPRRAVDCFRILFGRQIDDNVYGLATGEALAHLRHLEVEGRARREISGGVYWYRRI